MSFDLKPVFLLTCWAVLILVIFSPVLTRLSSKTPRWAKGDPAVLVLLLCSLAALGFVVFVCDWMLGATASWLFCGINTLVATGLSAVTFSSRRRLITLCLGAIFASVIIALHFVDLSPIKPYRRFFAAIQNGMTSADVMTILHREFPQNGRFRVPVLFSSDSQLVRVFLDPTHEAYNAEGVFVTFRDDRVVAKKYSPD